MKHYPLIGSTETKLVAMINHSQFLNASSSLPHSDMALGFGGSITRLDRSKLRRDYQPYFLAAFKFDIK